MPFQENSFDKVFCNNVIYFWDDPDEHLQEVYRVLEEGGVFYSGFRPGKSMRQFPFVKYGFSLYEEDEWVSMLERNGFERTEIFRRQEPVFEEDGEKFELLSVCIAAVK